MTQDVPEILSFQDAWLNTAFEITAGYFDHLPSVSSEQWQEGFNLVLYAVVTSGELSTSADVEAYLNTLPSGDNLSRGTIETVVKAFDWVNQRGYAPFFTEQLKEIALGVHSKTQAKKQVDILGQLQRGQLVPVTP